jgi:hypothetical protein
MGRRIGGSLFLKINGEGFPAKGSFTYNLGAPKREGIVGADGFHGFKEMPQVAFIEGAITDSGGLDVNTLLNIQDATATLELANGKVITLREAYYAGEGNITTEEGEIALRLEGASAEEIP